MTFFTAQCHFPGAQPLKDATGGWDVVYALKFSALNADMARREPWSKFNFEGVKGKFQVKPALYQMTATVSSIAVVPAALNGGLHMEMTVKDAFLSFPATPSQAHTFKVTFELPISLVSGSEPGLLHISFDDSEPQNLTVANIDPSYNTAVAATASKIAKDCLTAFLSKTGEGADLFSSALATIYTKDYAQSVNMPWLTPSAVNYTVRDLPEHGPNEGVLAILGSVHSDKSGLTSSLDPSAIPLDTDINAVVIVSPTSLPATRTTKR